MLFNSLQFAIFFLVVYFFYLILNHKSQNILLLLASCFFYAYWDWRFLFLLFSSISVDYFCAQKIYALKEQKARKKFLILSVGVNMTFLGFFKYFNFFSHNLQLLISAFGFKIPLHVLNIILPLGISFYTFEAISYVWDVYRKKLEPTRNYWDYALFVTYFPHLIAGPIMRAKDLLPQICSPRKLSWSLFNEGIYFIAWGLFEKMIVADKLANIVNLTFASKPPYIGSQVLLALYAFAFQIFCDFDGYSNIARGLGKCMGFDIMFNFNLPYFVTNPREFWQRWHISLSTWLRDYLYIPLGGNKNGTGHMYKNLSITMLLGGLWHGASWTFIIWGFYQGILLIIHRASAPFIGKFVPAYPQSYKKIWHAVKIICFFHLICLGWLFFRAQSLNQIIQMLQALIYLPVHFQKEIFLATLFTIISNTWFLLTIQSIQFIKKDLIFIFKQHWLYQGLVYSLIVLFLIVYGENSGKEFIYFQF